MDIDPKILIKLGVAASLALLVVAATRGRPKLISTDGSLLFRYSLPFRVIGSLLAFGMPLAISAVGSFMPPANREDVWAMLAIYAGFAAIGLPLWWEGSRFALVVSPEGLDCRSPWRGRRFMAWGDVASLSFSPSNRWFIIRDRGGRTFRVHVFVAGVPEFLARSEERLPLAALAGAKAGYLQVGRRFPGG